MSKLDDKVEFAKMRLISRAAVSLLTIVSIFSAFSQRSFAASEDSINNDVIGHVTVCYYTDACSFAIVASGLLNAPTRSQQDGDHPNTTPESGSAIVDAPAFQITNFGKKPIKSARFTILGNKKLGIERDSFLIGTISPRKGFVIIPGLSNDKARHNSKQFFYHSGTALDSSDSGPSDDEVVFEFTGVVDGHAVSSGKIVTGATAGPANDKTVDKLNFLGGPGNADGPCNDCFGPKLIGKIKS